MYLLSSAMSGWVCLPVCCCGWGTKVQYVAQLGRNFSQFLSGSCLQLHSIYRLHTRPISMIPPAQAVGENEKLFFSSPVSCPQLRCQEKFSLRFYTYEARSFFYITTLLHYYNNIYNNVHILDSRYLQFSWSLTKAWSWRRPQSSATQSIAWHN